MPPEPHIVEILARVVRDVGFPIAVAGVLLWAMLLRVPAALDGVAASNAAVVTELRLLRAAIEDRPR